MMRLQPGKALRTLLGYDAVTDKHRRAQPLAVTYDEDKTLDRWDRRKLVATVRDMPRNLSLAAWMCRKHLDYVSQFNFHANSGNEALDQKIEFLVKQWGRKGNCEVTQRHPLAEVMWLWETHKVLDGDCALLKLADGRLQAIEGDRICKPDSTTDANPALRNLTDHGLILDRYGAATSYCVCNRDKSRKIFSKLVKARDVEFDGYFPRFDSTRGVSPVASALNTMLDLKENWEYSLIKMKMHAMFGVAIYRDATGDGASDWSYTDDDTASTPVSATTKYDFDLRAGLKLELQPGDKIDTIESRTPSTEMREFSELMVRLSLLALDIPFTFYNSGESSYSAIVKDSREYEKSAKRKQAKNREILENLTEWKIDGWVREGALTEAEAAQLRWEWRAEGVPWIDIEKEASASATLLSNGLTSRQRLCKQRGEDYFEIARELEHELKDARGRGFPLAFGSPGTTSTEQAVEEEDARNAAREGRADDE